MTKEIEMYLLKLLESKDKEIAELKEQIQNALAVRCADDMAQKNMEEKARAFEVLDGLLDFEIVANPKKETYTLRYNNYCGEKVQTRELTKGQFLELLNVINLQGETSYETTR